MNNFSLTKKKLRIEIKEKRLLLPESQRKQAAQAIAQHFVNTNLFQKKQFIACYYPFKGEVNTHPIIQLLWQHKKTCYLPVLDSISEKTLVFFPYYPETILKPNRFGIPEPISDESQPILTEHLDLVLCPIVAVDELGNRLGMGAGFYDRTFAFKTKADKYDKPLLIGLAYEFQRISLLPVEPWDIPLNGVISEKGLLYLKSRFLPKNCAQFKLFMIICFNHLLSNLIKSVLTIFLLLQLVRNRKNRYGNSFDKENNRAILVNEI